jgi:hypothetical protein
MPCALLGFFFTDGGPALNCLQAFQKGRSKAFSVRQNRWLRIHDRFFSATTCVSCSFRELPHLFPLVPFRFGVCTGTAVGTALPFRRRGRSGKRLYRFGPLICQPMLIRGPSRGESPVWLWSYAFILRPPCHLRHSLFIPEVTPFLFRPVRGRVRAKGIQCGMRFTIRWCHFVYHWCVKAAEHTADLNCIFA